MLVKSALSMLPNKVSPLTLNLNSKGLLLLLPRHVPNFSSTKFPVFRLGPTDCPLLSVPY